MESVVLETSLGDIQLELYWDHAPKAGPSPTSLLVQADTECLACLPIDLQKLCRARETWLLQWCNLPPYHPRMSPCSHTPALVAELALNNSRILWSKVATPQAQDEEAPVSTVRNCA